MDKQLILPLQGVIEKYLVNEIEFNVEIIEAHIHSRYDGYDILFTLKNMYFENSFRIMHQNYEYMTPSIEEWELLKTKKDYILRFKNSGLVIYTKNNQLHFVNLDSNSTYPYSECTNEFNFRINIKIAKPIINKLIKMLTKIQNENIL
jgi:hypothetical protein